MFYVSWFFLQAERLVCYLNRLEVLIRVDVARIGGNYCKDDSQEHEKPVDIPYLTQVLLQLQSVKIGRN